MHKIKVVTNQILVHNCTSHAKPLPHLKWVIYHHWKESHTVICIKRSDMLRSLKSAQFWMEDSLFYIKGMTWKWTSRHGRAFLNPKIDKYKIIRGNLVQLPIAVAHVIVSLQMTSCENCERWKLLYSGFAQKIKWKWVIKVPPIWTVRRISFTNVTECFVWRWSGAANTTSFYVIAHCSRWEYSGSTTQIDIHFFMYRRTRNCLLS